MVQSIVLVLSLFYLERFGNSSVYPSHDYGQTALTDCHDIWNPRKLLGMRRCIMEGGACFPCSEFLMFDPGGGGGGSRG